MSAAVPIHLDSSPLHTSPPHLQSPLSPSNQSHNFPGARFVRPAPAITKGPRAPPPSEDSSSCADDDVICNAVIDEEERDVCMTPDELELDASVRSRNQDNGSAAPQPLSTSGRARKHRARSMNALPDLGGIDMTEAFARLAIISSSSTSPTRDPRWRYADGDDADVDKERGRPLSRKRPLERDGDEADQQDGLQVHGEGGEARFVDAPSPSPAIIAVGVSSRPMIPLRLRSMSRMSPSVSSRPPASAFSPQTAISPLSMFEVASAPHCGYQPEHAFTDPQSSVMKFGEYSLISGARRASDSAVRPHHSLRPLIGSESPIHKRRCDEEMGTCNINDTALSQVSSPTYTASTAEHDFGDYYESSTLLSYKQDRPPRSPQ
jgi:hypothetical protein